MNSKPSAGWSEYLFSVMFHSLSTHTPQTGFFTVLRHVVTATEMTSLANSCKQQTSDMAFFLQGSAPPVHWAVLI